MVSFPNTSWRSCWPLLRCLTACMACLQLLVSVGVPVATPGARSCRCQHDGECGGGACGCAPLQPLAPVVSPCCQTQSAPGCCSQPGESHSCCSKGCTQDDEQTSAARCKCSIGQAPCRKGHAPPHLILPEPAVLPAFLVLQAHDRPGPVRALSMSVPMVMPLSPPVPPPRSV